MSLTLCTSMVYLHLQSCKALPSFPILEKMQQQRSEEGQQERTYGRATYWKWLNNTTVKLWAAWKHYISTYHFCTKTKDMKRNLFPNTKGDFLCSGCPSCWVRGYFGAKSLCGFTGGLVESMDEKSINGYYKLKHSPWAESVWKVEKHCWEVAYWLALFFCCSWDTCSWSLLESVLGLVWLYVVTLFTLSTNSENTYR